MFRFRDFTIRIQVLYYLGVRFAKPRLFRLTYALCKPLEVIKSDIVATRNKLVQELSYSCSTIVMEKMLNDYFDPVQRRIRIINLLTTFTRPVVRMFEEGDQEIRPSDNAVVRMYEELDLDQPEVSDTAVLYLAQENGGQPNFIVQMPDGLILDPFFGAVRARVDRYKTAGKTYRIDVVNDTIVIPQPDPPIN
jgi:hypothetical protein